MQLTLTELRKLQAQLDARIFTLHNVTRESTRLDRCLALCVEIGELANETRCFKYWSVRPSSGKDVLLEELEDSVHFLLSLGIDLDDQNEIIAAEADDRDLSLIFLDFYHAASRLTQQFDLKNYLACFSYVCILADRLGFSENDLIDYYLRKNQKNHQRQDQNY